jgi:outer membrane protein assembly factor BamB
MSLPQPRRPWLIMPILLTAIAMAGFYVAPHLDPRSMGHFLGMIGTPVVCSLLLLVWWLYAMKGDGLFRWLPVFLLFVPAFILAKTLFRDDSKWAYAYGLPIVGLTWASWLVVSRWAEWPIRRAGAMLAIIVAWSGFSLIRFDGTDAEILPEISFRWQATPAELYERERETRTPQPKPLSTTEKITVTATDSAEFRGANRDGRVTGVSIKTDWATSPPKQLWKQRIGPGWGTFSVVGNRLFTQEQRGDKEAIVCLDFDTGRELWSHEVMARFYEQIAGAGPRSTPTIHDGRLYALGATGFLTCLDPVTGSKFWEIDVKPSTGGEPPAWGYASSPLVIEGKVILYVGGKPDKGTAAFNAADGSFAWASGNATHGYASAQRVKLAGVEQVLIVSNFGVESFRASDGVRLWAHDWLLKDVNRSTQAVIVSETDLVIGSGVGSIQASRRLHLTPSADATRWTVDTVWTTKAIKPYFNDSVMHQGHLYGFDDKKFVCVDLADGKQKWSTGAQYGHGQVVLLADQGLLVVQAVDGKVHLLEANPSEHVELGKFPALKGKTWNHPVVVRNRLLVRNAEEVACYELAK